MHRTTVAQTLQAKQALEDILIMGWVRTRRDAKGFSFLEINDGSTLKGVQVVADHSVVGEHLLKECTTGASVAVQGRHIPSPAKGQTWEIQAATVTLLGKADPEAYPLQKKRHSDEFLRTIAHLRPRTNKYGALTRIRSEAAFAVHEYFRQRGFYYVHTPIITGSDCEGAGEMFRVTTLDRTPEPTAHAAADQFSSTQGAAHAGAKPCSLMGDQGPFAEDFFGKEAFLTVSGQLPAEALACALGRVYTFGPTFRAENSNTARHAAEFWMIEPEMAFADLTDDMDLAEDFLKALVGRLTERCADDLGLFSAYIDTALPDTWRTIMDQPFARISHAEAISILKQAAKGFEHPVQEGMDLQTEHERFLTDEHFHGPVIVYDYPAAIKAFYMRLNDDATTVAAMDVLLPRVGEIIGGSQREERLDVLERRIAGAGLNPENYWWYADLRRFGSVPHAGFGMGFERFLMMLTGVSNIRDVIAFARTPKSLEF